MEKGLDVLSLTRKLLSFNTINPLGQEHDCAEYLGNLLEEGGFKVGYYEFAEGRTSLIARIEGNGHKAPTCFTSHIDTVPLGAVNWKKGPFSGELDGNKIYGMGSSDMKGEVKCWVRPVRL